MIQPSHCPETRHDGHDPVKGFAAPSAKAPVAQPAQALPGSDHLKLHYDRRWGSWRSNAVGVVAVVWADMQVEMENGHLGPLSSLIQEIRKRLCEAFGKDAVVGSSLKLSEVFVFLFFSKVDWVLKHQTQRTMTRMMMMMNNNNNNKKMMKDER